MNESTIENTFGALALAVCDGVLHDVNGQAPEPGSAGAAIALLRHAPGMPIERLRRALPLSHAAAVRLVDRLVAEDLVVRRPNPVDGRAVALYLTETGERRCNAILAARQKRIAHALAALDETERETLGHLVTKLLIGLIHTEDDAYSVCRLCDAAACGDCPVDMALSAT